MKNRKITFKTILCTLAGIALLTGDALGINPPPDGCYPNFTTAEGCNALQSLTTGAANTALGWHSLSSDSTGSFNTGLGAGALVLNNGDSNTAVGATALLLNTSGTLNTAIGTSSMAYNDIGIHNTAVGATALFYNTDGSFNTASGIRALRDNTTGSNNTAKGTNALISNTTGDDNTALGSGAGLNATNGSGNVYIGANMLGVAGESDTTYIRNVYGSVATARAVYINSDNKIGTMSSSRRYKEEIRPIDQASDVIFALKPVSFRYNKKIDRSGALCFGLIAEEVAEISPELITRDAEGRPQTVRYEAVNAMLLNEFLQEHKNVQALEAKLAQQQMQIDSLIAHLQSVSTQIEVIKAVPRMAVKGP